MNRREWVGAAKQACIAHTDTVRLRRAAPNPPHTASPTPPASRRSRRGPPGTRDPKMPARSASLGHGHRSPPQSVFATLEDYLPRGNVQSVFFGPIQKARERRASTLRLFSLSLSHAHTALLRLLFLSVDFNDTTVQVGCRGSPVAQEGERPAPIAQRNNMTGKEILHKVKDKVKASFGSSSSETGKGKSKISGKHIRHGFHLVKGKVDHAMEDYVVAQFRQVGGSELGLFAIFDGHLGHNVADYLQSHLFDNILNEPDFWTDTESAIRKAYQITDGKILEKAVDLGRGGSTAVTAILINGEKLVVANVGDSRAVICKNGVAKQLSVDHEPSKERQAIESKGGFVSNLPGDVPRVDGQLAVARAFGDCSLKAHLSSDPDVVEESIDPETEFLILASDGLWKVMENQEAVDSIKTIKDAQAAAKHLTEEALSRKSKDDISCIVVTFH